MIQHVLLPKLGQTMEEATVETWRVKEGDVVKRGDVLLEITTDKATLEVESFVEGTVRKILAEEGRVLPVNAVLALVGEPEDELPEDLDALMAAATSQPGAGDSVEATPRVAATVQGRESEAEIPAPRGRIFISPRARRLARERNVGFRFLSGSGPNGRIVEKDVLAHVDRISELRITPTAREIACQKDVDLTRVKGTGPSGRITKSDVLAAAETQAAPRADLIPLTPMRRIVAERMSQSKREIPHFYLMMDVDMTEAVAYRQNLNAELAARGHAKVAFHDLVTKACAMTFRDYPQMNCVWEGDAIRLRREVNIGLAVALDNGLIVPVVRDADRLSLEQIAAESSRLIARARGKRLTPDEYEGGCFTISNLGMFDVDAFVPVINPGESAILGLGRIVEKAVVRNGGIHIRAMMTVVLAADHRAADGATSARFLKRVKDLLEAPENLT